jgi:RNA polymerase sigma-70 factor (ECF subfamily)
MATKIKNNQNNFTKNSYQPQVCSDLFVYNTKEQHPLKNDQQLISSGERDSEFRRVFGELKSRVFNTALGLVQNRHDAEDVTQEVFVNVHQMLDTFRGESQLSTWIYRITVNKSLDFLKAQQAKKRAGFIVSLFGSKSEEDRPIDVPDFVHPGVQLERQEAAVALFRAINQLPEQQKVAFTLSKVECLSYQEIADILQTTIPSVESLLFRAKQNLQKRLRDFYENEFL